MVKINIPGIGEITGENIRFEGIVKCLDEDQLHSTPVLTLYPKVGQREQKACIINKAAVVILALGETRPILNLMLVKDFDGKERLALINSKILKKAGENIIPGMCKLFPKSGKIGGPFMWKRILPFFRLEQSTTADENTAYRFDLETGYVEFDAIDEQIQILKFKEEQQVKPIQHCIEATTISNQQIKNNRL